MKSSGLLKGILVVVALLIIGGVVYYFVFNPGNKYNRLVSEADGLFSEQQYEEAEKRYAEALEIRADETHPRQRLKAIDSLQRQLELDIRYDEKVQKADLLYSQGKYQEASQYYFDALNIKTDEEYPVNQIKKIRDILQDPEYAEKQKKESTAKNVQPPANKQTKKTEPKRSIPPTAEGKYFHVIVGVFEDHKNAIEMKDRMVEMGKESMLIQRPGNMEAVTFGSYDNIHTAFNFLKFVRNDVNEDAWVLYHETK
jgi:tetratricopeptide (TPR) repeat protein